MLHEEFLIIRKIVRLLGKSMSSFPAVRFGSLHYRSLERDKISAIKFSKVNFEKRMEISQSGRIDVLWWINNIKDSFCPGADPG